MVAAGTAINRIRAKIPTNEVVAPTASNHVGIGIPHQVISERRTGQVFKPAADIPVGLSRQPVAVQAGRYACRRICIGERIHPCPADQRIRASSSFNNVIASPTADGIDPCIPGQIVGKGRTGQVLDIGQRITGGFASRACSTGQGYIHPGCCGRIVGNVSTTAPIQTVRTGTPYQRVAATFPQKGIIAEIPVKNIPGFTTPERIRSIVTMQGIGPRISTDIVIPRTAIDGIGTIPAIQKIGPAIPRDHVIVRRAVNVFDLAEHIPLRIPPGIDTAGQIDHHRGTPVGYTVNARAPNIGIGPKAGFESIVARTTFKTFRRRQAIHHIVERTAHDGFNLVKPVPGRIAPRAQRPVKMHVDGSPRRRIIRNIRPCSPGQYVRTRAANQGIISGIPEQTVVTKGTENAVIAVTTMQNIGVGITGNGIGKGRTGQILDTRIAVPGRIQGAVGRRSQVNHRSRRGIGIRSGVRSGTPDQNISACPPDKNVVPVIAIQRIDAGIAGNDIRVQGAQNILKVGNAVPLRIPRTATTRQQGNGDGTGRIGIGKGINAITPVKRVPSGTPLDTVISIATCKDIDQGIANQRIAVGTADQVFDAKIAVPRRITPGTGLAGQIGRNSCCRRRIVHRVCARTPINLVRARIPEEGIITCIPEKRIVTRCPGKRITAILPAQGIGSPGTGQGIVARSAPQFASPGPGREIVRIVGTIDALDIGIAIPGRICPAARVG